MTQPEVDKSPTLIADEGQLPLLGSIETLEGSVRARVRFNADLDPRVAVGEHGWWQACAEIGAPGFDPFGPDGANFNLLIGRDVLDPVSGTPSQRAYLCEIRRAA